MEPAQDLSKATINDIDEVFHGDGLSSPHILMKKWLGQNEDIAPKNATSDFILGCLITQDSPANAYFDQL